MSTSRYGVTAGRCRAAGSARLSRHQSAGSRRPKAQGDTSRRHTGHPVKPLYCTIPAVASRGTETPWNRNHTRRATSHTCRCCRFGLLPSPRTNVGSRGGVGQRRWRLSSFGGTATAAGREVVIMRTLSSSRWRTGLSFVWIYL